MSVKEAGFFSLQLQQIVRCKVLLAIMPLEPSLQVNCTIQCSSHHRLPSTRKLLSRHLPSSTLLPWRSNVIADRTCVTLNYNMHVLSVGFEHTEVQMRVLQSQLQHRILSATGGTQPHLHEGQRRHAVGGQTCPCPGCPHFSPGP